MPHLFERAPTGRAKCRGCAQVLARGELRFGERIPNPFAEGEETTLWFHPMCAACKRPEPLLQALVETIEGPPDREDLERVAQESLAHRRLPRIDGAERSPSGQAKCRSCHQPIARGIWRIRLVFHEDGRFSPGGFLHLECRQPYFEIADVLERLLRFSPSLEEAERQALSHACSDGSGTAPPPPTRA